MTRQLSLEQSGTTSTRWTVHRCYKPEAAPPQAGSQPRTRGSTCPRTDGRDGEHGERVDEPARHGGRRRGGEGAGGGACHPVILSFRHRSLGDEFRHHVHEFSGHCGARHSALVLPSAPSVRNSLQLTRFSEHRARWQSELRLSLSVIGIFALSGEGVPALHSMTATGLSSRHRLEFGTRRLYRFWGLEAGARGI